MKIRIFKKLFTTHFSLFLILALICSCNYKVDDIGQVVLPEEIENKLNNYQKLAYSHYLNNPDSAEYYFISIINLLDSSNYPQFKVNYYIQLCELYQYRKPDYFKSMIYLSKAIRILIQYSEYYNINAFLLINIGNQFYNFGFYNQAINLYKTASEIDNERNHEHARITAFHNISLSYKNKQMLDSAEFFIELARKEMPIPFDIKYALNDVYASEIHFLKNENDSVLPHIRKIFYILNKNYYYYAQQQPDDTLGQTFFCLHEIASNTYRLLSKYYFLKNDYDKADNYFAKGLKHAYISNSQKIIANLYFNKLQQCFKKNDDNCLKLFIDSAEKYIFSVYDLSFQKNYVDSMCVYLKQTDLKQIQQKYLEKSHILNDSIKDQKSSFDLQQNLMLLSSIIAENTAYKQKLDNENKIKVIKYQKTTLLIIILLFTVFVLAFIKILNQNHHLNNMYKAMVEQVKMNIKVSTSDNPSISKNPAYKKFENELEQFIVAHKPYLNKNITLNELASMLNTNQTYVSNYINTKYSMNFNDFINKYRVNEACKLLLDEDYKLLTIEKVAELSGFNSKSTFYMAFKKIIGMTPVIFLKNNRKE